MHHTHVVSYRTSACSLLLRTMLLIRDAGIADVFVVNNRVLFLLLTVNNIMILSSNAPAIFLLNSFCPRIVPRTIILI
jgi:hypothetical protein